MEPIAKSQIINVISEAIDSSRSFSDQWILKKSGHLVQITMTFCEPETFTDANGVKWVRSH